MLTEQKWWSNFTLWEYSF